MPSIRIVAGTVVGPVSTTTGHAELFPELVSVPAELEEVVEPKSSAPGCTYVPDAGENRGNAMPDTPAPDAGKVMLRDMDCHTGSGQRHCTAACEKFPFQVRSIGMVRLFVFAGIPIAGIPGSFTHNGAATV